jgi:hypothetical protein
LPFCANAANTTANKQTTSDAANQAVLDVLAEEPNWEGQSDEVCMEYPLVRAIIVQDQAG